jgi:putative peptidoglycan lipid II flippase
VTEPPAGDPAETADPDTGVSFASVGRSALILTGATAAVQLLGIVRELFLAAQVGISTEFDAVLVGLVLPMTLSSVLTAGVSTALVPAYIEARASHGPAAARRLAGTVLTWMALAGLGVTLLLELLAPGTVIFTGPGLDVASRAIAVDYLRLVAPITTVAAVSGILYAVCQAEEQFGSIAWSILAGPASTLVVMLALWDRLGLGAFVLGTLVGPFVSLAILVPSMARRKLAPRPSLRAPGLRLGALAGHAFPLTVSSAILQLNAIFDRAVASLIAPGAVSALRYGDTLVRVPTGAISPAWGAAIYPALVRSTYDRDRSGLADAAVRALQYVIVAFVPIAALTLAVAPVAVSTAYGRGAFTSTDLNLTALVVAGFAPLVLLMTFSQTLTGSLNARRSGKILLASGIINVIVNCSLDLVLGFSLGVAGIALSSSVTAIVVSVFKAAQLGRRERAPIFRPLGRYVAITLVASAPGVIVVGFLSWTGTFPAGFFQGLVTLTVFGTVGLAMYVVVATRLGLSEPRILAEQVVGRLRRRPTPGLGA